LTYQKEWLDKKPQKKKKAGMPEMTELKEVE
jgi:hypothetical protein